MSCGRLEISRTRRLRPARRRSSASGRPEMSQYASDFVVQEYIPGADDCIYSFHAYLDRQGTPLGRFVGRKIRTYPKTAGVSTYLRLVHDPEVMRTGLADRRPARSRRTGQARLQARCDPRTVVPAGGERPAQSLEPSGHGVRHQPAVRRRRDLHGQAVEPMTEYRTGVRWLAFGNDLRTFAARLSSGSRSVVGAIPVVPVPSQGLRRVLLDRSHAGGRGALACDPIVRGRSLGRDGRTCARRPLRTQARQHPCLAERPTPGTGQKRRWRLAPRPCCGFARASQSSGALPLAPGDRSSRPSGQDRRAGRLRPRIVPLHI